MKIATSITLSEDLLKFVDARARQANVSRSDLLEEAIREFVDHLNRDKQNATDLAIIDARADFLNEEAADVLTYQVPL
ncbi:MAG: ribbon-helix-helix domain-containing protein [Candidatus Hydrogenedentes bacterium]|nr:ribbon-helix-helix domain-containing protein [Candidatus Hydrogenedentota bacterium]